MKVSRINRFFRKVGELQIKYRWVFLIDLLAVTLVCLSGFRNFRSESNNEDWIVNGSEIQITFVEKEEDEENHPRRRETDIIKKDDDENKMFPD